MALRSRHGNARNFGTGPVVEVLPPDELPAPVPAEPTPLSGVDRRQNGTVATPEAARALGARGGRVKAKRVALARSLALGDVESMPEFAAYRRAASAFRRHHCAELAKQAGGMCGSAPSSMVASAALQLAASRFLFDQGAQSGDPAILKTASQLSNDSRQNLLAAYELAQRSAAARPRAPVDPLAAFAGLPSHLVIDPAPNKDPSK
jgi:hypothetical protein